MMNRRLVVVAAALTLLLILAWSSRAYDVDYASNWDSARSSFSGFAGEGVSRGRNPAHITNYFEQVFSAEDPKEFPYKHLKDACARVEWAEDAAYLKCTNMAAGLTSIVSQVKVCLKMAVDTGSNLVLPAMPLRDSKDLTNFNFLNGDAYLVYDEWFDVDHLRKQMERACPKMKIIHPKELDKTVPVKHNGEILCSEAHGYEKFKSYFWTGRPFKHFFNEKWRALKAKADAEPNGKSPEGITVVTTDSEFLLFRITDDPTGREMRLWNDLSHLIRYREEPRRIIDRLLQNMDRPHFGVHFRVENDSMWSSLDQQLKQDLDSLDRAWSLYGRPGQKRPLVYLACGDAVQVEKFVAAGAERGWEVTHKWRLTEDDPVTTKMINDLAFDFQGAIDQGMMMASQFFMGITGSAFSVTVANQRDITGRYRGSSFDVFDDEGARSHLHNDLDASQYACCL